MIPIILFATFSIAGGVALLIGAVYTANRIDEMFERRRDDDKR